MDFARCSRYFFDTLYAARIGDWKNIRFSIRLIIFYFVIYDGFGQIGYSDGYFVSTGQRDIVCIIGVGRSHLSDSSFSCVASACRRHYPTVLYDADVIPIHCSGMDEGRHCDGGSPDILPIIPSALLAWKYGRRKV